MAGANLEAASNRVTQVQVRLKDVNDWDVEYVNQVHADADRNDIQIVFSRLLNPMITSEQDQIELARVGYVNATVVARIVMPPSVVKEVIDLLQVMLDKHQSLNEMAGSNATGIEE